MIAASLGLKVFREGFAPHMTVKEMTELRDGCRRDDPALLQGRTTNPPPLLCVYDYPCEGGCAIGYAGWRGGELGTVGEVVERFQALCAAAGDDGRWFLRLYDDTPRDRMLKSLADEIDAILALRA